MIYDANGQRWRRAIGFERRLIGIDDLTTVDLVSCSSIPEVEEFEAAQESAAPGAVDSLRG